MMRYLLIAMAICLGSVGAAQARQKPQVGVASYYGKDFAGRLTSNGERFNPSAKTVAHRTLPLGTVVKVTNLKTGKATVARVNDRGPYVGGRVIDVSQRIAHDLGFVHDGLARVSIKVLHKPKKRGRL